MLTLACRPDPGGDDTGKTTAPAAADHERRAIELTKEVRRLGFGVDLASVSVEVRPAEGMTNYVTEYLAMVRQGTTFEAVAQLRRALGISPITDGTGMRAGVTQMLVASIATGFLPEDDVIVVREELLADAESLDHGLIQAIAYAYLDQKLGGLGTSVLDSQAVTDAALVRQCLVEGFGLLLADWVISAKRGQATTQLTDAAAALLGTHANVPCLPGSHMLARLQAAEGWQAVVSSFGKNLASTEQLLHPEKYETDFPVPLQLPSWPDDVGEATLVHDDVLGELAIERLLRERGYDDTISSRSAVGWDGDRLGLWRLSNGKHVLVWRTAWDREEDAQQFIGTIAPLQPDPYGFRIAQRGRLVDAVSTDSEAIATRWMKLLADEAEQPLLEPGDAVSTREIEAAPPPHAR